MQGWYDKRKCRRTASMFGVVVKRRKSIYPKSIVKTITKPSQTKNASCLWGTENEKNALLRYHQYKDESNLPVNICESCKLVVNPKWPCGAVQVKYPASKSRISVLEVCSDVCSGSFVWRLLMANLLSKRITFTITSYMELWLFAS